MMKFLSLKPEDLPRLFPYFSQQAFRLSDYTVGFQIMWSLYASTQYAEVEGCLILRSNFGGRTRFNYPLSPTADEAAELRALEHLEKHCVLEGTPLVLGAIPSERLTILTQRYGRNLTMTNPRTWRDYLYNISDFADYVGKRFSGQRNHVSKFRRNYPNAVFRLMTQADIPAVKAFLEVYAERQYAKNSFIATEELKGSFRLLDAFESLQMVGGILEDGGNVIAVTIGDVSGDTLVIHVEKALVNYEGVYPTIAHEFAKAMRRDGLNYINREDDAGDCGLRKSKLQYNPVQILDKYTIVPNRIIEELDAPPTLHSERLTLRAIGDEEVHAFGKLARNIERNRFWGWDWRDAWKEEGDPRDAWFLELIRNDFKARREISLGIYCEGQFCGEAVFHNFTYDHMVELGVRLLPEAEGKGYATEAMRCMADYALCFWGLEKVVAKCYRDNLASKKMLQAAGLRPSGEDEQFCNFFRTAKN